MTLFLAKDMRSIFVRGRPEGFEVPNTVILFGHKKSGELRYPVVGLHISFNRPI